MNSNVTVKRLFISLFNFIATMELVTKCFLIVIQISFVTNAGSEQDVNPSQAIDIDLRQNDGKTKRFINEFTISNSSVPYALLAYIMPVDEDLQPIAIPIISYVYPGRSTDLSANPVKPWFYNGNILHEKSIALTPDDHADEELECNEEEQKDKLPDRETVTPTQNPVGNVATENVEKFTEYENNAEKNRITNGMTVRWDDASSILVNDEILIVKDVEEMPDKLLSRTSEGPFLVEQRIESDLNDEDLIETMTPEEFGSSTEAMKTTTEASMETESFTSEDANAHATTEVSISSQSSTTEFLYPRMFEEIEIPSKLIESSSVYQTDPLELSSSESSKVFEETSSTTESEVTMSSEHTILPIIRVPFNKFLDEFENFAAELSSTTEVSIEAVTETDDSTTENHLTTEIFKTAEEFIPFEEIFENNTEISAETGREIEFLTNVIPLGGSLNSTEFTTESYREVIDESGDSWEDSRLDFMKSSIDYELNQYLRPEKVSKCDNLICPEGSVFCRTKLKSIPPNFDQLMKTSECLDFADNILKTIDGLIDNPTPGRFFKAIGMKEVTKYSLGEVTDGDFYIP